MAKKREKRGQKPQLKSFWQALDEAAFGPERTLNLRELLPSAAEARARTEVWLRARQVTRAEEVLIVTGRGNQSLGGVGVIRNEILGMLPSLRRRGIVESWREHSPGSVVVKLARLSALIGAGKRRRDTASSAPAVSGDELAGITLKTRRLLRELALSNLHLLGIEATEQFVQQEMARTFSTLSLSVSEQPNRELALDAAVRAAIDEQQDR